MAAKAAVIAFTMAWDDCVERPDADFGDLMQRAITDLRTVVSED